MADNIGKGLHTAFGIFVSDSRTVSGLILTFVKKTLPALRFWKWDFKSFWKTVVYIIKHPKQTGRAIGQSDWFVAFVRFIKSIRFRRMVQSVGSTAKRLLLALRFWKWDYATFFKVVVYIIKHPKQTWHAVSIDLKRFARWSFATLPRRMVATALIIVTILAPVSNLLFVNQTQASWWDDQWQYRKSIVVNNTSGSVQTDFQVKILSNYDASSLVSAGKLQSSLNDLRFTDSNSHVFPYWIEDATNTSVDVWVKMPTISSVGGVVYMYYGNALAASQSSTNGFTMGGAITEDGGYRLHTFTSAGTFTSGNNTTVEVYAWGGGGGGGYNSGAGGGGGAATGFLSVRSSSNYPIIVGGGGSSLPASGGPGPVVPGGGGQMTGGWGGQGGGYSGFFNDSVSQASALLIAGGGGGGSWEALNGGAGGGQVGANGGDGTDLGGRGGSQSAGGSGKFSPQSYGAALQGGVPYGDDTGGGGAGGGGYWGGGGGANTGTGSAGGGGSGYYNPTFISSAILTAGSGTTPGSSANALRGTAGNGGAVGNYAGTAGVVIVRYVVFMTASAPGSEEKDTRPAGPAAYWKFDEGTGIVAHDSIMASSVDAPSGTGGTISQLNGYWIHTFTSSGTFTPAPTMSTVEMLVVAGGGGGGMDMGGGGGGGGVISSTISVLPNTAMSVVVGSGGTGAPAGGTNGQPSAHQFTISATAGGNSTFGGLTAIGGGYGGSSYQDYTPNYALGGAGGSGGGASGYTPSRVVAGGAGTAGQGYRGGNSYGNGAYCGGGGGGAGGAGTDGNVPNGGPGVANSILGTTYYWGGGGGGNNHNVGTTPGNGGSGGGGGGTQYAGAGGLPGDSGISIGAPGGYGYSNNPGAPGGAGGANTGGGGGGGTHYNSNNKGGDGGSGIVVIKYPVTKMATPSNSPYVTSATGGTITTSGGYRIHTFTGSGTFTPTTAGNVDVFAWGGGGAGGTVGGWVYGAAGGAGGAAQGKMTVTAGSSYPVVVGGGGGVNSYNGGSLTCATGGGACASWNNSDNRYGSGGGGYSGVFNSSVTQANSILIAGGGGGGGSSHAGTGNAGGAGGGAIGQDGLSAYDGKTGYAGKGGTQTSAGADASCDGINTTGAQGALQGGRSKINSYGGAGGGGYWGGSGGGYSESNTMAGGGGGSSYYNPTFIPSGFLISGSGMTPGDVSNPLRGSYGNAGSVATAGNAGVVIFRYPISQDGTLTNMSSSASPTSGWQTEDQCVSGKCLAFDGVDDYVAVGNPVPDSLQIQNQITLESWIYATHYPNTGDLLGLIVGSQNDTNTAGASIFLDGRTNSDGQTNPPGHIHFQIGDGSWHQANTTTAVPLNQWVHVVATRTANQNAIIYFNGVSQPLTNPSWTGSINYTNATFQIGRERSGDGSTTRYFNGRIDEPKVYSYARTKAQILQDYNAGLAGISANKGTIASFGDGSDKWMSDGLVGYWKMDESSWNGTAGEVKDWSGNNNNGTAVNGATTSSGKFGNGGSFDGTNDYVDAGSSNLSTGPVTISMWVKSNALSQLKGMAQFNVNSTGMIIYQGSTGVTDAAMFGFRGYPEIRTSANAIVANTWQYITYSYNGGNKSSLGSYQIFINGVVQSITSGSGSIGGSTTVNRFGGDYNSAYWSGSIDETRIYNRALSPAEIKKLYDWAPGPVGEWKLDENTGTLANDTSGNNNTGTLTNGPTWTTGKVGAGVRFDGVDDYMEGGNGSSLQIQSMITLEAWVYHTTSPTNNFAIVYGSSNNYDYGLVWQQSTGRMILGLKIGGTWADRAYTNSIPENSWVHIVGTYNGTRAKIYRNGVLDDDQPLTGNINITAGNSLRLGYASASNHWWRGSLDDIRIYNYARTQEQIMQDMTGNIGSSDLQTTKEAIAYYKFDEGSGATANNLGTGGSALNGTLTNMASPATSTSGWTDNGKVGKGLNFDGVNDYVTLPSSSSLAFGTGPFSITLWYKTNAPTSNNILMSLGGGSNSYQGVLGLNASNRLLYYANGYQITEPGTESADSWNFATLVGNGGANGSRNIKLYRNGVQVGNTNTFDYNFTPQPFMIGVNQSAYSEVMHGSIDEVKIFPYALSADDVKTEYNHGNATNMASSGPMSVGVTADSARAEYCPPGNVEGNCASGQNPSPVGEWKMDEGTGTSVSDTSGNNNAGILTNGPTWTTGKYGKGLNFDGVDDAVNIGSSSSLSPISSFSISSWFKYKSSTGYIYSNWWGSQWRGINLGTYTGQNLRLTIGNDTPAYDYVDAGSAYNDGSWHHVVGTYDQSSLKLSIFVDGFLKQSKATSISSIAYGANACSMSTFGDACGGGYYFAGSIDQVRIYNYARTPAQIAYDYNRGGPVGWWKMDECQGTTINDASGNGNIGALTVGGSGTQASAGTCSTSATTAWSQGATGKFGSSLNFDGTDDYIDAGSSFPQPTDQSFSMSAWVKSSGSGGLIVSKMNDSVAWDGYYLREIGGRFNLGLLKTYGSVALNLSSATSVSANTWYHVAVIYNGSQARMYINGILDASASYAGGYDTTTVPLSIGGRGGSSYAGQIDDVRIYNYALSADQVKLVMNNNSALAFGTLNTSTASTTPPVFGQSQAYPGASCKSIIDGGASKGDGTYWIDPNGGSTADAFQAYCDMTTAGGGWTLLSKIQANTTTLNRQNTAQWRNLNYIGSIATLADENALGQSYSSVPFTDVMVRSLTTSARNIGWRHPSRYSSLYSVINAGNRVSDGSLLFGSVANLDYSTYAASWHTSCSAVKYGFLGADYVYNNAGGIVGFPSLIHGHGGGVVNVGLFDPGASYTHNYGPDDGRTTNCLSDWSFGGGYYDLSGVNAYALQGHYWGNGNTYTNDFRSHGLFVRDSSKETAIGQTKSNPGVSCLDILNKGGAIGDGTYWIDPNGGSTDDAFQAYCDMTTNGGGWTLVANVAPGDGNSVGYNNQSFWTTASEYRSFFDKFSGDYKSPAAYLLPANSLMIQSAATAAPSAILGWRSWPMTSKRTFGSMFSTGIVGVHATDACETGSADATSFGSTSSWDDIIRQGTCLYTDVNPSGSGEADLIRLTTIPYNSTDNMMAGFATCIDCGTPWQGANPYMGLDRAGCNSASCNYSTICRVSSTWNLADCRDNYCTNPTYRAASCDIQWNSRFYVR